MGYNEGTNEGRGQASEAELSATQKAKFRGRFLRVKKSYGAGNGLSTTDHGRLKQPEERESVAQEVSSNKSKL